MNSINENFEISLWKRVNDLFEKGEKDTALYTLFSELNSELENTDNCNNFLIYIMSFDLISDVVVHVFGALAPVKNKLKNWEEFVKYGTAILTEKVGEKDTKIILKLII